MFLFCFLFLPDLLYSSEISRNIIFPTKEFCGECGVRVFWGYLTNVTKFNWCHEIQFSPQHLHRLDYFPRDVAFCAKTKFSECIVSTLVACSPGQLETDEHIDTHFSLITANHIWWILTFKIKAISNVLLFRGTSDELKYPSNFGPNPSTSLLSQLLNLGNFGEIQLTWN